MRDKEDPASPAADLRIAFFLALILIYSFSVPVNKTCFTVNVVEKGSSEPVAFASIIISNGDSVIKRAVADVNGHYTDTLDSKEYVFKVASVGYLQDNRPVSLDGEKQEVTISMGAQSVNLDALEVKSVAVSKSSSSADMKESGDDIILRGSRGDGTEIYVDGVKSAGAFRDSPAKGKEEKGIVMEGGPPASYGDRSLSGRLSAGEINDFAKWKLWEKESREILKKVTTGFGIEAEQRYCFQLTNKEGWPVTDATIILQCNDGFIFRAEEQIIRARRNCGSILPTHCINKAGSGRRSLEIIRPIRSIT